MPSLNVYLPDDLASQVAAAKDRLNVSAVCQRALREELAMLQATEHPEVERLEVDVEDHRTGVVRTMAFEGRWLVEQDEDEAVNGYVYSVAVTRKGRIAVWSGRPGDPGKLEDFDTLEKAEDSGVPEVVIADTRAALTGEIPIVELDI